MTRKTKPKIVSYEMFQYDGTTISFYDESQQWTNAELAEVIKLLPTPTVVGVGANKTVDQWESWTGAMKDRHGNGNGHGASLNVEAQKIQQADRFGQYQPAVTRWSRILDTAPPEPTLPDGRNGNHRLNPEFAAWMQALHNHKLTETLGRRDALKAVGNSVNPLQAEYAVRGLLGRRNECQAMAKDKYLARKNEDIRFEQGELAA